MLFDSLLNKNFIDANKITVYRDSSDNQLKLTIRDIGEGFPIKPIRYFPYTSDEYYIGLFLVEPNGKTRHELVIISDLRRLDKASIKLIKEELNKIQPILKIKKILSVKDFGKLTKWSVDTEEKGVLTFELGSERDITFISALLMVLKDIKNINYKINLAKLDVKSYALIARFF